MHEVAIATRVVEHVLEIARGQQAVHVETVELEVGTLQLVVPEALEMAFVACAHGTLLEGATLKLVGVRPQAECRTCAARYEPAVDNYRCPECGAADAMVVAGNDIVLKSVTLQTQEVSKAP